MADENQNQPITDNNDFNFIRSLGGNNSKAIEEAMYKAVSRAMKDQNPKNKSQSFFNDRRNDLQIKKASTNYRRTGNVIDDLEQGIKDELLKDFRKAFKGSMDQFSKQFGFEVKDLAHEYGKHLGKLLSDSSLGKAFKDKAGKALGGLADNVFGKGSGDIFKSVLGKSGGAAGKGVASMSQAAGSQAINKEALFKNLDKIGGSAAAVAAVAYVAYKLLKPLISGLGDFLKAWGKSFNKEEDMRKKRMENAQKRLQADMEWMAKEPFEILTNAAKAWEDTWDKNLNKISLTQGYTKENVYDLYESVAQRLISEGLGSVIPATDVINNLGSVLESGLSGKVAEAFAYEATKLSAAIPTENFMGYASTYAQMASEAISKGMDQADAIDYANMQLEQFASNLLYSSRTLSGGFSTGLKDAQSLLKNAVDIAQTAKSGNVGQISGTLTAISGVIGAIAPDLAQGLVQNVVSAATGGNSDTIVALRSLAGINAGNTAFLQALANNPQGLFVTLFRNLANMQSMSPANYMEVAEGLSSVFGVDMKAFARVDFNQLAEKISEMSINETSLAENIALLASGEATMSTEQLKLQEINNQILDEGLAYVLDSEAGRMMQQHMWDEQIANQLAENEYAVSIQGAALTLLEGLRHSVANILNFLNPIGYVAKGVQNMVASKQQSEENTEDLYRIVSAGAVGSNERALNNLFTRGTNLGLIGSLTDLMGIEGYKSTTGQGLSDFAGRFGSTFYNSAAGWLLNPAGALITTLVNKATGGEIYDGASWNAAVDKIGGLGSNVYYSSGYKDSNINSLYSGFTVGKSLGSSLSGMSSSELPPAVRSLTNNATAAAYAATKHQVEQFIASAAEASKTMSHEQFLETARDYGISDLGAALEEVGYTQDQLKEYFEANETMHGAVAEQARKEDEQAFRDETRKFWDYTSGTSGIFQMAMWSPFLNDNFKPFFDEGARFDQRMDIIDQALTSIQLKEDILSEQLGDNADFTVISALTELNTNIETTFVRSGSAFQKCLADWVRYIAATKAYTNEISSAQSWSDLKRAEGDAQNETLLALANAMNVFSADELKKLDPQMQANALLGEMVILLQTLVQQNNTQAGGLSLPDTLSALGLGITNRTGL